MRARIVVLADLICVLDRGRDEKTESQTKRLIEKRGTGRDREALRGPAWGCVLAVGLVDVACDMDPRLHTDTR